MGKRKRRKLVHEGRYVAEVDVELIEDDTGWSPYLHAGRRVQARWRACSATARRYPCCLNVCSRIRVAPGRVAVTHNTRLQRTVIRQWRRAGHVSARPL